MDVGLERHCADYILRHCREKRHATLRKQTLEHWREHYGEAFAATVEKIVRAEWKKGTK